MNFPPSFILSLLFGAFVFILFDSLPIVRMGAFPLGIMGALGMVAYLQFR